MRLPTDTTDLRVRGSCLCATFYYPETARRSTSTPINVFDLRPWLRLRELVSQGNVRVRMFVSCGQPAYIVRRQDRQSFIIIVTNVKVVVPMREPSVEPHVRVVKVSLFSSSKVNIPADRPNQSTLREVRPFGGRTFEVRLST